MTVSLRDFKKGIQDLKEELAHLTKGSEEYNRVAKEIRDAQGQLKSQMEGLKDTYQAAEGSYDYWVQKMAELKKEWRATGDEMRRNELGAQIDEINTKLKDFDASIGNHQRSVGNYEIATKSLRQEYAELKQQLARGIVDEKSTEELKAIVKQAGNLRDAMKDAEAMINEAADDVRGFTTALDVANTAMAGFTAAQGLAQLLGDEDEEMKDLVKTMQQLQAATATLNGLQQIQTALVDRGSATYRLYHKAIEVYLRLAVGKTKAVKAENTETEKNIALTKTDTTVQTTETTVKGANTVATLSLANAWKVLRIAMVSSGVGVVVVALGAVLANITDITKAIGKLFGWLGKVTGVTEVIKNVAGWVSDNVDAFKKWAHITEEKTAADIALENAEKALKKASEEYYETLGKERVELQANIARLKDFKGSKEDEKKIVDELNSKYGNTLGTYKNINDWQKKLVTDGEKYIQYLYEEAKATALAQEAARVYADWKINNIKRSSQENLEAKRIADEAERLALEQASKVNTLGASLYGGDNANTKEAKKQRQTAKKQQQDLLKDLKDYTDETIKLINHRYKMEELNDKATKESELNRINEVYNIQSQYYDAAEARLNKALKNVKEGSEEWKKINDAILSNDKARADAELKYEEDVAAAKKKIREDEKKEQEKTAKENANKLRKEYDADINALNREQTQMLNDVDPVRDKNNIKATEAYQQQVFDIEKAFTLKRIELLNQMAEALKDQPEAYEAVIGRIIEEQDKLTEAERQRNEESKNNAIEANNQKLQSWMELSNSLSSLMGGITDFYQQQIDEDVKAGKITEKEAKKRFEQVKKAQIATAIISTISGAVGAYKNAIDAYPAPFDIAIGIANAATVLASGMAQVQKIKSTQYGSNGGNGSSGGIMSAKVAPLIDTQDVANIQTPNVNATVTNPEDQRVYVVESDIANAGRKVQVRESETQF